MALFLNEQDVESLLHMSDALEVLDGAIREQGQKIAMNRPRQIVKTAKTGLSVLPAAIPSLGSLGFKTYTVNPAGVRFWLLLFGDQGELQAIMEAEHLGMVRTGAASGIATRYLSRPDSKTAAIIGTGYQAPAQIEAVCKARSIEKVVAWSRTREHLVAFCERMTGELGVPVEPANDAASAVKGADVVVTITSSKDPVVEGEWLAEGAHVNVAGAMKPSCREVDTRALERAELLVVDDWHQSHEEAGEFIKAAEEGALDWDRVVELGAVVAGAGPRRTSDRAITLFKSHGVGLWDVAVAARIYQRARERNVGIELPIQQQARMLGRGTDPHRLKV